MSERKIDEATMDNVEILAKLALTPQERQKAMDEMEKILTYVEKLNELDTDGIEPMSHVFPVKNVFREDVVTNGDGSAETLANAPLEKDQSFKVPKTIG
jgi:aspartyl-tRNA(Asn)/glutamyl-tRNA(Gln) amidotransferase subunit C